MAYDSVITANHLAIAGITGALATLLSGKTVAQASAEIDIIYALVLSGKVAAGGIVRYSLDGQSAETDIATLEKARNLLGKLAGESCGIHMLPVEFSA